MSRIAPLDSLPTPHTSDARRDADTPAFLALLRREYGGLESVRDVLEMLGVEAQ